MSTAPIDPDRRRLEELIAGGGSADLGIVARELARLRTVVADQAERLDRLEAPGSGPRPAPAAANPRPGPRISPP